MRKYFLELFAIGLVDSEGRINTEHMTSDALMTAMKTMEELTQMKMDRLVLETTMEMILCMFESCDTEEFTEILGKLLGGKQTSKVTAHLEALEELLTEEEYSSFLAEYAVQVKHYVTGDDALISLAGPANKQGRIIADNICGGDSRYLGSQGSSVIKVFDITAATTGINETNAKKSGLEVDTVILSPMSHAGYYPGGKVMTMKVVFEKETYRLLGAQIIGYEGVDKRIDVLATAIHAGLKATQLKDLDLAYAPPYSSAKDPVNMAGFMIDNIAKGTLKQWHLEDMDKISRDKSVVLLDVRTVGEFNRGHMDGFKNIPVDELRERINEIEKGKPVYLICQSGLRSYIASRILEGNGYETYNFSGGFRFYDAVVNDRALIEKAYACGMDY